MAELQYIFDDGVDKDMEEFMGPKWWRKDVYQRGPALVFLEHMKYPDEAEFTIRQKGSKKGTVKVLYSKPSEAEENELNSYADDIIKILEKHIVNREQMGEEVTRLYSEKTGQSGKPGTGPANMIRRFLNVQPPKKKKGGGSRKKRTRRSNTRKARRRSKQRGGQSDMNIAESYPMGTVVSTDPESGIDGVPTLMGNTKFAESQEGLENPAAEEHDH
jgi:hypothetical protein